jgi:predicted ATPase
MPFTVIVGPNASGKTTFLKAIEMLFHFDKEFSTEDSYQKKGGEIYICAEDSDGKNPRVRHWSTTERSAPNSKKADFLYVDFEARDVRVPFLSAPAYTVGQRAENLVNVFATLGASERASISKIFCHYLGVYSEVDLQPAGSGYLTFKFRDAWDKDTFYSPHEVSDGTLLILAYIVVAHQSHAPDVLAIESLEREVHPYLLKRLVHLLRGMSEGKVGPKKIQTILTTHSSFLLDEVQPQEVLFFNRNIKDGKIFVTQPPINQSHWQDTWDAYQESLGGMWLSGGLGGVPGSYF